MEQFKEKLKQDLNDSMKSHEKLRLITLRSITNAITVAEKDGSGKDVNHIDILTRLAKQRRESIELYEKAGSSLLADIEKKELAIIEEYLPKEMNDQEIEKEIDLLIGDKVLTQKDMGPIINAFKTKFPGQNGGKISQIVKSKIA